MYDDRICTHQDRGAHIQLYCERHPDKRWSTKNIAYIGARSIFYNLRHVDEMGPECPCPGSLLRVCCKECNPTNEGQ